MRKAVVVLLLLATARAGDPDAFEKGLAAARAKLAAGRFEEGRKRLLELLDAHARADYVLGRRTEVEDLMRELVLGASVPEPAPKTLVSGELLAWNPHDGTIKLRYTPATMKDWAAKEEEGETTYLHPVTFRGPYTLVVKGPSYPSSGIVAFVCHDADGAYAIGLRDRAQIVDLPSSGSGDARSLDEAFAPFEFGRAYEIRVTVGYEEIRCSGRGKTLLRCGKSKERWGSLALRIGKFDEILVTGRAEPSWIQGLVDGERQRLAEAFVKRWDPKAHLPDWLGGGGAAAEALARADGRDWPGAVGELGARALTRAFALVGKGEASAALRTLDDVPPDVLDGAALEYGRAIILLGLGRHAEAAAACERVRQADPEFAPVVHVEARALARLGRPDDAVARYDALLRRFPGSPDLHARAALFLGSLGRWDDADRVVRGAMTSGVRSDALDGASRTVHKARNGPAWPRRHEHRSTHYTVLTDMDVKTCLEASQVLEQAYALFVNRLEHAPITRERFKVFLFSGEAGYQNHVLDLFGTTAPHSAGLYAPALRQLFIWNLPSREAMLRTVRHEGFHQYLHQIMDDPPLWFNEGLAEYFEEAEVVRGEWVTGVARADHLDLLGRPQPLERFLFLDAGEFMANAPVNYAQAWAFIHFLFHSTPENRKLFDRFWESFKTIPAHADAIRDALGPRTIEMVDSAFVWHLTKLRKAR